jgi:integrase/recombinase XerD
MTSLCEGIAEYLELRRCLGFRLKEDEFRLKDFASFAERRHATHITVKLAVEWVQRSASTDPNYRAGRLRSVRGFARYRVLSDPRTEIPATDLLPRRRITFQPHIFSKDEIARILEESLRPHGRTTHFDRLGRYMIYGLISVTGMRVGEVLNLDHGDVDLDQGIITIRNAKFGKSRLVPVHETTRAALRRYREQRAAALDGRGVDAFFVSAQGGRIVHTTLDIAFRRLTTKLGLRGASDSRGPRLHDLRHTMAVEVLRRCYSTGADPERQLPALSTYLGHTQLSYTYWYLHQNPELMAEAVVRLQHRWEASG